MRQTTLKFYFDYISPNAYLAWTQLPGLVEGRDLGVDSVPVLFGALLDAHGQRGPAEIPAKMDWMVRDVLRKAARLNVPLRPPASHPFNPLLALRVSSLPLADDEKQTVVTAIFDSVWARGLDVSDTAVLGAVLDGIGVDGPGLIDRAQSTENKQRLRWQTAAASDAGVFGVPTIEVGGERFWGLDDFAHLEAFLDGADPLPEASLDAWAKVRPSARRKGVS